MQCFKSLVAVTTAGGRFTVLSLIELVYQLDDVEAKQADAAAKHAPIASTSQLASLAAATNSE